MAHTSYWRAEANEEEEVRNPRARAADKADYKLERHSRRLRPRFEEQRRTWNWTA